MVPTRMSRRALLRTGMVGLGASAAMAGGGCSGFTGGGDSHGSDTISVTWWGDADRAALYNKALALYTKQHAGVKTTSSYADLDPYLKRLATQAASGDLPDVIWMRDTHVGRYGSSGSLLDLHDYLGKTIKTNDLGETAVADGRVGEGDYALPTHYVGQCVITNSQMFDKLGMSYPENPSWDDLGQLATHMAKSLGKGVYGCNDPTLGTTHRHFQAYVRQSGAELFNNEGGLGFGSDVLGEWLNFWQKLRKAGAIPPADVELQSESTDDQNLLVAKKAGFLWESSNHLPNWQELIDAPLKMYSLPTIPNGSKDWWFFPPILISVSAKAQKPDECADLVNFFLNSKEAAKITLVDQGAPSSSAIRKYLLPMLSKPQAAFIQQIDRESGYPRRPNPIQPLGAETVNDAMGRLGQQVAYGKQSISAAVASFMTEAKKALSK